MSGENIPLNGDETQKSNSDTLRTITDIRNEISLNPAKMLKELTEHDTLEDQYESFSQSYDAAHSNAERDSLAASFSRKLEDILDDPNHPDYDKALELKKEMERDAIYPEVVEDEEGSANPGGADDYESPYKSESGQSNNENSTSSPGANTNDNDDSSERAPPKTSHEIPGRTSVTFDNGDGTHTQITFKSDGSGSRTSATYDDETGERVADRDRTPPEYDYDRGGPQPVLLDLDGNGIDITELSHSNVYVDAGGDGLLHRTAWAGAGDGVLFYDPDGRNDIIEKRQYVFTEWDPTAGSDMEALASVFDSNGDGVLDASDAAYADFKVLVTNADGSTTAKTLAQLGITSINLRPDATHIKLPDGSVITGQTTFTRSDGTTGTAADVTLVAEADGYRLEQVESFDGAGTRTEVTTAYAADGSIAFINTTVVTADGSQITNSYDDNGDGVVDRLQTITTVTQPGGEVVKTVTNSVGATAATAILTDRTVTTTSADGKTITIERDSTGGGWFDQTEVRITAADGSMTIVTTDFGQDGTMIRRVNESVSADGMTRTEAVDRDGDGAADSIMTRAIIENPDGSRSETVTIKNPDNSVRSAVTETVSADGKTKTISHDLDGDGNTDIVENLNIATSSSGSTSTMVVTNRDGSTRSSVTQVQSSDALTKTTASDLDGDGDVDTTSVDTTVINPDGSRVNTVTVTNTDGSVRSKQQTTLGADKVTSETREDLNQNGVFETTDLVRSVSVNGTTGERTATSWDRNADGSVNATSTTVTSSDGLTRTTSTDSDGDGDIDTVVSDVTTVDSSAVATREVTTTNQDGSLRSSGVSETSADGLTTTTTIDVDGDGTSDGKSVLSQTNNADGSVTRTVSSYAGDGVTLLSETVSEESADRRVVTMDTDSDGDGNLDFKVVSTQAVDGSRTVLETKYHADGNVAGTQTTHVNATGLETISETDADGDTIRETVSLSKTVLNADGSKTLTKELRNHDESLRSQTVSTTSDDGLIVTTLTDADGDGVYERSGSSVTTLQASGSRSTTTQTKAHNGDLISQSLNEISDDGLTVSQSSDADGDGIYDLTSTSTKVLLSDGGTSLVSETRDSAGVLRSRSTVTKSDDGRNVTRFTDDNGDGHADETSVVIETDDGVRTSTTSQLAADGTLQSSLQTVVSANGLETTIQRDLDGDGTTDLEKLDTTTLNADGSTTRVISERGGNGTSYKSSTTVTSDDGLTITRTNDYDADGTVDLMTVVTTNLASDGVQTKTTTRTSADGSILDVSSVETSADHRTIAKKNDLDGDGTDDIRTTISIRDDGRSTSTTTYLSSGGVVEGSYEVITSGDDRTKTRLTDRNGDGEIDLRSVEITAIGADGTSTRTVEHRGQYHTLIGQESYAVSDDGMSKQSSLDIDGNGVFDSITDVTRIYAENGDIIRHDMTRNISADVLSDITTTTSGDGLTTNIVADYSGDGSVDRTTSIVRGADGGFTSTIKNYGTGFDLKRSETHVVSSDERTSTKNIDLDGDGFVDQRVTATIDLNGNTTTTYEDVEVNGVISGAVTGFISANGMQRSYSFDVDGDGVADLNRTTTVSYETNGDMTTVFEESYDGVLTYKKTTTTAADGLSSSSSFDVDGDGSVDGTSSSTTTLNADGSRNTASETHYADGDLRSSFVETVSADGRTTTRELDYDGNGVADKLSETVVAADGTRVTTETSLNASGVRGNTFITTTSADGLTTTVMRQGNVQTTTRSVLDNGSYEWDNGVAAGIGKVNITTSHEVDALGIETWKLKKTWQYKDANNKIKTDSSSVTVRLDAQQREQIKKDADSIFDAVLDRGLDTVEREALVEHITDGQLNKVALINHLMESSEYSVRYGTMSDAEFITQIYMNSYGRAPSMTELAQQLHSLKINYTSRAQIALDLADSVEHGVVGNGHMRTNNFDVIMNPAVFERSLDRAYVESVITNIVDVVYDRDPTEQELAYLSKLLLEGDKQPKDIVGILMEVNGDLAGSNSASLHDLKDAALVEQAFKNALGRAPTQTELDLWVANISGSESKITVNQFLASLAQSAEHFKAGNGHIASVAPNVNVVTGTNADQTHAGTDGVDHFVGGQGNDKLKGGAGNDIYEWSKNDGNDRIYDDAKNLTETDTLRLVDVNSNDVRLTRTDGSMDLVIEIVSTGETITVEYQYSNDNPGRGVERIEFAGGSIWYLEDIYANTKVTGATGNSIDGKDYDDNLYGLSGNDRINGNKGDDKLVGGLGDDELKGGEGSDTYIWERGHGADKVEDIATSNGDVDKLILSGVNSVDVQLIRENGNHHVRNDLKIIVSGSGADEVLYVFDQFKDLDQGVEQIIFADGVIWDRQDIIGKAVLAGTSGNNTIDGLSSHDVLHGNGGNDTLNGASGDDTLAGGTGNDTLKGGIGGDTYIWSVGDGNDLINEEGNSDATQHDHLKFTDVNSTDVVLTRSNSPSAEVRNDLYITINGAETITVWDQLKANGEGLEQITFADGVVWNREDILNRTRLEGTNGDDTGWSLPFFPQNPHEIDGSSVRDNIYGLAGNDKLDAGAGDDWLYGGTGNDTLWGDSGNDTYVYASGDGNDEIWDTSATNAETDTLKLIGMNADEVTLSKAGNDLIVTITATGETITVKNRFNVGTNGDGDGVEFISFADGEFLEVLGGTLAKVVTNGTATANTLNGWGLEDVISGLGGNDTIDGNGGNDTLIGGAGDDYVQGDTGSDTYIWAAGDGNDTIFDSSQNLTEVDVLKLTDINSDDVSLDRWEDKYDLRITILSTGEVIIVKDRFLDSKNGRGIEEIRFADGVVWSLDDIRSNTKAADVVGQVILNGTRYADNLYGLDGNDTITGFDGDDRLIGGTGDDLLKGGNGNDTYVWSRGDGNDSISEKRFTDASTDTLLFTDVTSEDVTLVRFNTSDSWKDDLRIIISGSSGDERVDSWDQFGDPTEGIEQIEFSDGEVWTRQDILERAKLLGTSGNDNIEGLAVRDNIFGLDGNDTIEGKGGDDHLHGEEGNDILRGDDGNDSLFGGAGDDKLFGGKGGDALFGGAGNDTLSGDGGVDIFDGGDGVDTVDFTYSSSDNVINLETGHINWPSVGGMETIVNVENVIGSSGVNVITGSSTDNRLEGRGGNDILVGGDGADTIIGGDNDDQLSGGAGADLFVFNLKDDKDVITDFEDGTDMLDFSSTGLTFNDITITVNANGSTVISYGYNEQVELENTAGQIDQSDFIFV